LLGCAWVADCCGLVGTSSVLSHLKTRQRPAALPP